MRVSAERTALFTCRPGDRGSSGPPLRTNSTAAPPSQNTPPPDTGTMWHRGTVHCVLRRAFLQSLPCMRGKDTECVAKTLVWTICK
jgi:hypothetical protein